MPPKKGTRKSLPEGRKGITLTHSRRSPRVTSPRFDVNDNTHSLKTPAPSSGDIRFYYNPKTPTSSKSLPSASPDVPSTRRRIFQARPSRLSNVYTPVVDTPNSSQSSRRTRRMTALDTPQTKELSDETPEGLESTGWSFDQYMGGSDGTTDPASPSVASSKGTRASARLRKPTTRAIESRQTDMARTKITGRKAPARDSTETVVPEPSSANPKPAAPKPAAPKPAAPKPAKSPKTTKGKKGKEVAKPQQPQAENPDLEGVDAALQQLEIEAAGRRLYELARDALRGKFVLPADDPLRYYNEALREFEREENAAVAIQEVPKKSDPEMQEGGWVQSGRSNNNGEEVLIAPPAEQPYWLPKTYLDESLSFPPVRSRPIAQTRGDVTLGFPPRLGDRNIPFELVSPFEGEDVLANQARPEVPAAPAPTAPAQSSAPAASTRAKGKRRQSAPAPALEPDSAQPAEDSSNPKPRKRVARSSLPAGPVTAGPSSSKAASARRNAKAKKPTVKAQDPTVLQGTDGAADDRDVPQTFPRLKLSQPRPEASAAVEQSPGPAKGKKRAAGMMAGEPASAKGTAVKRSRLSSGVAEASETPKRAASTKKGKKSQ